MAKKKKPDATPEQSEENEANGQKNGAAPEKSAKKWLFVGGAVLIVILLGLGGGWFFFQGANSGASNGNGAASKTTAEGKAQPQQAAQPFGQVFELETFVVNLKAPAKNRAKHYLKTELQIEYADPMVGEELNRRLPQIRDIILMHMGTKTPDELREVADKIALKNELVMQINDRLTKGQISNIYFTNFIIQ